MHVVKYLLMSIIGSCLLTEATFAAGQQAVLSLTFNKKDTVRECRVTVIAEGKGVKDAPVKVYVKRLFGLLPVKEVNTDKSGSAIIVLPNDIPGDAYGMITVVAKIEDDENLMNVSVSKDINWGIPLPANDLRTERALSASGGRTPIPFIVASLLIIAGVWATLIYAVLAVFRMRKISSLSKKM